MSGTGSNQILTIAYIAAVIVIFYFLWYRPQQAQRKKLRDMMAELAPGDRVMTAGGLIGMVRTMDGDTVGVEIADGVVVTFTKRAIIDRLELPVGSGDE